MLICWVFGMLSGRSEAGFASAIPKKAYFLDQKML
jgi:hypothetical protein